MDTLTMIENWNREGPHHMNRGSGTCSAAGMFVLLKPARTLHYMEEIENFILVARLQGRANESLFSGWGGWEASAVCHVKLPRGCWCDAGLVDSWVKRKEGRTLKRQAYTLEPQELPPWAQRRQGASGGCPSTWHQGRWGEGRFPSRRMRGQPRSSCMRWGGSRVPQAASLCPGFRRSLWAKLFTEKFNFSCFWEPGNIFYYVTQHY